MQDLIKVHCIHYFSNHTIVNMFWLTFKYLKECKIRVRSIDPIPE